MNPMLPKLRLTTKILLAIPVAVFVYVTAALLIIHHSRGLEFSYEHAGTDLTFASSDGGWNAEEDLMRGRGFKEILVDFELYRIRTQQPDVRLLRTKPWKKPWQWAWWFDRRSSPKWKIPFVSLEHVPPASAGRFHPKDPTPAELAQATGEAEVFLRTLR